MLAFLTASIFQAARLLPATHPYTNSANIRKFGIRDVFAEAGNHLVFDRQHIDQILIFFTLMFGFVLFILQFVFLLLGFVIRPVQAGAFAGMFATTNPTTDIAFELMDRVFGVPGFFNSCVALQIPCGNQAATPFPSAFHTALQGLFQYYSVGLLIVAVIIFLYYFFVVIAETAQTGTPFGRRFSHIWAPIRLVVALGLLIPLNYGLNAGQYIVLGSAKLGSGFATNGWLLFNTSLSNGLGVEDDSLYGRPKIPDVWPLAKFMLFASTCKAAYAVQGVDEIKPYLVKAGGLTTNHTEITLGTSYDDALAFYNEGNVVVRFGQEGHPNETGSVKPYCGEVTIQTTVATNEGPLAGAYAVQAAYFDLVTKHLWSYGPPVTAIGVDDFANAFTHNAWPDKVPCTVPVSSAAAGLTCDNLGAAFLREYATNVRGIFRGEVDNARVAMINGADLAVPNESLERGWAMAGTWYNKIAEMNGAFFGAVGTTPLPTLLPLPMQIVQDSRRGQDQNLGGLKDLCTPSQSGGTPVTTSSNEDSVANVLNLACDLLANDSTFALHDYAVEKGNFFETIIGLVFGAEGLFSLTENSDVHPLAQLVGLGKGIMDATIRNLFTASVFSAGGGAVSAVKEFQSGGAMMATASKVLVSITTITLTLGFILYYVLPFLPFMYFFFAVGTWVKTVFEAMVGVPLWALGHLRIDGHGLPGESAVGGYYMILEIFLRPILTVFGLIAGLIIFSALAKVLNEIFGLVTSNLAGFDNSCAIAGGAVPTNCPSAPTNAALDSLQNFKRNVIDQFFFTIIYTFILYMMATSSFKMIDQVPQQIMRWMGANVRVFADEQTNIQQHMTGYLAGGAATMTGQLTQGVTGSLSRFGYGAAKLAQGESSGVAAPGPKPPTQP